MNVQIGRWGNSLGIRIPSVLAKELGLRDGAQLDLQQVEGRLVLRPLSEKPQYSLHEMLAQITPDTLHEEADWGEADGKER